MTSDGNIVMKYRNKKYQTSSVSSSNIIRSMLHYNIYNIYTCMYRRNGMTAAPPYPMPIRD